jgi:hypothetical protein
MRITLEHRFAAPVGAVVAASNDAAYQERLADLPNVAERRITTLEEAADGSIHRVVRYKLGAHLPPPVAAVVGTAATWDEIADFEPATNTWTFEIRPHVLAGRIECRGTCRFLPDGEGTRRVVEVDLGVKVPLVGGRVEREIGKGLEETMGAEARLLEEFIRP